MPQSASSASAAPPSLSRNSTGSSFRRFAGLRSSGGTKQRGDDASADIDPSLGMVMNPMADYTTAPSGPRVDGGARHPINAAREIRSRQAAAGGHRGGGHRHSGGGARGGDGRDGRSTPAQQVQQSHSRWEPASPPGRKDPESAHNVHVPHHHTAAPTESSLRHQNDSKYSSSAAGGHYQQQQPMGQQYPPQPQGGQQQGQGQQQLRGLTLTQTGQIQLPVSGLDRKSSVESGISYGHTTTMGMSHNTLGGMLSRADTERTDFPPDGGGVGESGKGWKHSMPWNVRRDQQKFSKHEGGEEMRERQIQRPYQGSTPGGGGGHHPPAYGGGHGLQAPPTPTLSDEGTDQYTIERMMREARGDTRQQRQQHEDEDRHRHKKHHHHHGHGHRGHGHGHKHSSSSYVPPDLPPDMPPDQRAYYEQQAYIEQRGYPSHLPPAHQGAGGGGSGGGGGGNLHPLHRDSIQAQRATLRAHHRDNSNSSSGANSGSAITPAPNSRYYQKESAWLGRLAEKNTASGMGGYDPRESMAVMDGRTSPDHMRASVMDGRMSPAHGHGGGAPRPPPSISTYASEPTYEDRFLPGAMPLAGDASGAPPGAWGPGAGPQGRDLGPPPGGRYSPTRPGMLPDSLYPAPATAPMVSPPGSYNFEGSHTGDVVPGGPYSTGKTHEIDSRLAHGGMSPEQYDAYLKAQERNRTSQGGGGAVANPRLAALQAEEALHFHGGPGSMVNSDDVLNPDAPVAPSERGHGRDKSHKEKHHRGYAAHLFGRGNRRSSERGSVEGSERPSQAPSSISQVPSDVAHGGMTPEQHDAWVKAQERNRQALKTSSGEGDGGAGGGGGGGGGAQLANPRLAALSEPQQKGAGASDSKSRLGEDHPMKQGRVVPVWESKRNVNDSGMPEAEVTAARQPVPPSRERGTGPGLLADIAGQKPPQPDILAPEQMEAYEKARAEAEKSAGTTANPRLASLREEEGGNGADSAAGGAGNVAREQVEAYEKAQARAKVGASAVANPRLAHLSAAAGGGAVAQEQVDAYAKAQARGGVRDNLVAQEQVDAYEKAQAKMGPGAAAAMGAGAAAAAAAAHPHMDQPHGEGIEVDASGGPLRATPPAPFDDGEYTIVPNHRDGVDESLMVRHLIENGFTNGLASALVRRCASCPLRVWLVDNSGSMLGTDGHRVVQDARARDRVNAVDCTRWEEVGSTVTWHAQMCAVLKSPVVFRMLNDPGRPFPQQMSVAERSASRPTNEEDAAAEQQLLAGEVHLVRETFRRTRPTGGSNLSRHLRAIYDSVSGMAEDLRRDKQRVAVVVVTDGLPTDDYGAESEDVSDEFMDVLRKFAGLPVWIVVRLSTDEKRVIKYYNGIDSYFTELGPDLSVDVLDDFVGEAREVRHANPWLNYALPLHLVRESGMRFGRVFDAIDERPLTTTEVRDLCGVVFGRGGKEQPAPFPDPDADWAAFEGELRRAVECEREQWDPIKERVAPWIDFRELDRIYGGKAAGAVAAGTGAGAQASRAAPGLGGTGEPPKKQGCACVIQ